MFLRVYAFSTAGNFPTASAASLNHLSVMTAKGFKTFDGNRTMTMDVNLLISIYFVVVCFFFL